jgi:small subunit ribosomal protein S17
MPPTKKTTTKAAPKADAPKKTETKAKEPKVSVVPAARGNRRRLTGVVTSDKMMNTVTVQVDRTVLHAKYQKRYVVSKKYLAHNEGDKAKAGQTVIIEETRPLSARKRWRVVEILK